MKFWLFVSSWVGSLGEKKAVKVDDCYCEKRKGMDGCMDRETNIVGRI